jgi:hypothetical protein
VSVVPSAGPDEGEPVEPAGASVEPDERDAAEVGSVRQWAMGSYYRQLLLEDAAAGEVALSAP